MKIQLLQINIIYDISYKPIKHLKYLNVLTITEHHWTLLNMAEHIE